MNRINNIHTNETIMRVLIAEDEPISCRALEKNIADWGYETVTAKDGLEAWSAIKKNDIQLAVLDWMMPEIDGVELCRRIHNRNQENISKAIYVILLTGRDQAENIIAGLSAGADDYVAKPFDFLELKIRLQNGERILNQKEEYIDSASYDKLTQVWNRNTILGFFNEELVRGRKESRATGFILVDVDHLESFNRSHGHFIGDTVLFEVAKRLKKNIRGYDRLGRYGGDELAVVLPHCGLIHVEGIAERLRRCICDRRINTQKGPLEITISLVGTSSDVSLHATGEELRQACERALLSCKEKGSNTAVIVERL